MKRTCIIVWLISLWFSFGGFAQVYQKPRLSQEGSWSIILLPDIQSYVKFERNQAILDLMTAWISENIDSLQIKMVLATGDLVERNEMITPNHKTMNQPSKSQWEAASRSFSKLDGKVPYITATGNHDYSYADSCKRNSHFDRYFPVDKNFLNQKLLKHATNNTEGVPTLENALFEWTAPDGTNYVFLTIEFAPRNAVVEWAGKMVNKPEWQNHRVILLTHSYLNSKNERIKKEKYEISDANYGESIFRRLVQPSRNIELVISGHIGSPDNFKGHVGFRSDKNASGKSVHQMVFNAQALGGGWYGNGGDGWLRILEFLPDGKTVLVKTFSPLFAISPTTQEFAWSREAYNEFSFTFD